MLEVVGVTGVMHLGQIQSGLKSAIRIVQVSIMAQATFAFWKTIVKDTKMKEWQSKLLMLLNRACV